MNGDENTLCGKDAPTHTHEHLCQGLIGAELSGGTLAMAQLAGKGEVESLAPVQSTAEHHQADLNHRHIEPLPHVWVMISECKTVRMKGIAMHLHLVLCILHA